MCNFGEFQHVFIACFTSSFALYNFVLVTIFRNYFFLFFWSFLKKILFRSIFCKSFVIFFRILNPAKQRDSPFRIEISLLFPKTGRSRRSRHVRNSSWDPLQTTVFFNVDPILFCFHFDAAINLQPRATGTKKGTITTAHGQTKVAKNGYL